MRQRTVFLIPSEDLAWGMLRLALLNVPEAQIVGEARTLEEAAIAIPDAQPDIIFVAVALDGVATAPLLRELRRTGQITGRIILLAAHPDPDGFASVADLDLTGYLVWNDLNEQTLIAFLVVLLTGRVWICSAQAMRALPPNGVVGWPAVNGPAHVTLTERERRILRSLAAGRTQEEIASEVCLSVRTVKRAVAELQEKLGVRGPIALGMRIQELGLTA
jgi:DNA-binding NarL/FixJ family response regulator